MRRQGSLRHPGRRWTVGLGLLLVLLSGLLAPAPRALGGGLDVLPPPGLRHPPLPDADVVAEVNPPTLRWPAGHGPYRVRLSQDPVFPAQHTLTAERAWALWNPHRELAAGPWHWQVASRNKKGIWHWSDTHTFRIAKTTRVFVTPEPDAMLRKVAPRHPRLLLAPGEVAAFRKNAPTRPEAAFILRQAKRALRIAVPAETDGRPAKTGKNALQKKRFADWAAKGLGSTILRHAENLVRAWLLTGDERFGHKATAYAEAVAGFDPDGVTSPDISDFADGACLMTLALVYDGCDACMSEKQRTDVRAAIGVRAARLYARWRDHLESKFYAAHVWQTILRQFTYAAFSTLGEIPEARTWAAYVYELWLGRFPLLGGDDGGWANGNNYFRTGFDSMVDIPLLFKNLTGVDFFSHPWYAHTIPYLLYTWPPGSYDAGFGDGYERRTVPNLGYLGFMDVLSHELQDPLAALYVQEGLKDVRAPLAKERTFAWLRLRGMAGHPAPPVPRSLASLDLPPARAFPGVGIASMHADLAHRDRDLHVALRASPYGNFNHAHADQNSVNLLLHGRPLLYGSGYYIAYGDAHYRGWYKHSRGHNTVLIDDKGQAFTPAAVAHIERFLSGKQMTYALGDASDAYPGTGLTRFRRHVVFLPPDAVILYDDLAADHAAIWTWCLHTPGTMRLLEKDRGFAAKVAEGEARIDLLASTDVQRAVRRIFDPPADNWRGVKKAFPDQGHATARTTKKATSARFLAVIRVRTGRAETRWPGLEIARDGTLRFGGWTVRAVLDAARPAALLVENAKRGLSLAADRTATEEDARTNATALTEGSPPHTIRSPSTQPPDAGR